ncbi:MAG: quinone-dependent dihydroorotate dehydrogenase [Patescibacteria group bacterium]|jgi:dihydroorotate dehydrogenase subfamily 2
MKTLLFRIRNVIGLLGYRILAKPIFFRFDPEVIHDFFTSVGEFLGSHPVTRALTRGFFDYSHSALTQSIGNITFKNPVGLAAGFDKNARLMRILPAVGFGFSEVGTVTGLPCAGNAKPRLWRHAGEQSLRVYYGLKNDGCDVIANRMAGRIVGIPVGVSIGKTNDVCTVETGAGIADYLKAYRAFEFIGDYITLNISCPNAFGGEPFTDAARLDALLTAIDPIKFNKPHFLKMSPDLSHEELDAIIAVATRHGITGFISTNLTKKHDHGQGGISGAPIREVSNAQIKYIYEKTNGQCVIIGCGGIFSAADAYEKIKNGASLLELITGMIYEGPSVISEINRGLVELLEADGYTNISQAVGANCIKS